MDLICRHSVIADRPVLQVAGEIDLATVPTFRDHLTRIIGDHPGATVLVDLDGVTALDDTGMGMLLGAAGRAREQSGDLVLVTSDQRLLLRFTITGLDRAVRVQPRL
jgi:anti-sigma B factor antagonist